MEKGLEGKRIVLAASRKTDEMSVLIEKQGGSAIVRSLQGTVFLAEEQIEPELRKFVEDGADWIIFTTGIGIEALLHAADKLGIQEQFLARIREAKVGARGYKAYAALKKMGITLVAVDEDGTTQGLVQALQEFDFSGQRVMVQLHGESAPRLTQFLEERGASVLHLLPYQHIAPETETVEQLCQEIIAAKVDAVCFTTAIQVRSLFQYATEHGYVEDIRHAFGQHVVAVAVGKVTAEPLREEGIERLVVPELERMGAMIVELSQYYKNQQ